MACLVCGQAKEKRDGKRRRKINLIQGRGKKLTSKDEKAERKIQSNMVKLNKYFNIVFVNLIRIAIERSPERAYS